MWAKRVCEVCSSEYRPTYKDQRTCGRVCGKSIQQFPRNKLCMEIKCLECSELFNQIKSHQVYCSVKCRNIGVGKQIRKQKFCKVCKKNMFGIPGRSYCSDECKKIAFSENTKNNFVVIVGNDPIISPRECSLPDCKNSFPWGRQQFCSQECIKQARKIGFRAPRIIREGTCFSCKNVFRREEFPSNKAMFYCSDICQRKEIRQGEYWTKLDDGVTKYHSKWEMKFATYCDDFGFFCKKWDRDPIQTPVGPYYPDFIVQIDGVESYIEIKVNITPTAKTKISTAKEILGERFFVMGEPELIEFRSHGAINDSKLGVADD